MLAHDCVMRIARLRSGRSETISIITSNDLPLFVWQVTRILCRGSLLGLFCVCCAVSSGRVSVDVILPFMLVAKKSSIKLGNTVESSVSMVRKNTGFCGLA